MPNNGTLVNGPTWVDGKFGKALNFNGVNQYVTIPDAAALNFGTSDSFTITCWFKSSASGVNQIIVRKNDGTPRYRLQLQSANKIEWSLHDGTNEPFLTSNETYNDGNWHHVAAIRNVTTDRILLYIDGILRTDGTDTTTATLSNTNPVRIADSTFNGSIDDVRIHNRALSQAEITDLMNNSQIPYRGLYAGLVGEWLFNEGTGLTAYDTAWTVPLPPATYQAVISGTTYDVDYIRITEAIREPTEIEVDLARDVSLTSGGRFTVNRKGFNYAHKRFIITKARSIKKGSKWYTTLQGLDGFGLFFHEVLNETTYSAVTVNTAITTSLAGDGDPNPSDVTKGTVSSYGVTTILVEDQFNRANSNTVGGGWTETEAAAEDCRIASNRLNLGTDPLNNPLVFKSQGTLSDIVTMTGTVKIPVAEFIGFRVRSTGVEGNGYGPTIRRDTNTLKILDQGTEVASVSKTLPATDVKFRFEFNVDTRQTKLKAWDANVGEPNAFDIDTTPASITASGTNVMIIGPRSADYMECDDFVLSKEAGNATITFPAKDQTRAQFYLDLAEQVRGEIIMRSTPSSYTDDIMDFLTSSGIDRGATPATGWDTVVLNDVRLGPEIEFDEFDWLQEVDKVRYVWSGGAATRGTGSKRSVLRRKDITTESQIQGVADQIIALRGGANGLEVIQCQLKDEDPFSPLLALGDTVLLNVSGRSRLVNTDFRIVKMQREYRSGDTEKVSLWLANAQLFELERDLALKLRALEFAD